MGLRPCYSARALPEGRRISTTRPRLGELNSLSVSGLRSVRSSDSPNRVLECGPKPKIHSTIKKNQPSLIDPKAGVKLVGTRRFEKIGSCARAPQPEAGKLYWMAFPQKQGKVGEARETTVGRGDWSAFSGRAGW